MRLLPLIRHFFLIPNRMNEFMDLIKSKAIPVTGLGGL
jgi:hypothetical protein